MDLLRNINSFLEGIWPGKKDEIAKEKPEYGVGELPLSWGTSLAIEALGTEDNTKVLRSVSLLRVNLLTLIRNTYEALIPEKQDPATVAEFCLSDARYLVEIMSDQARHIKVEFYFTGYRFYKNVLPNATLKAASTEKQKKEFKVLMETLKILQESNDPALGKILEIERKSGVAGVSCLLLTHVPADLLSKNHYGELLLLESHTGKIKKHPEWSSKIVTASRRDYAPHIPFTPFSLTVLGDGNKFLRGGDRKAATTFYTLAFDERWNPRTTEDKIKHDIKKSGNADLFSNYM